MATKTKYFALGGGLDVVTSAMSVSPGKAIAMANFEPWYDEGYRRIAGFERFDGRPSPSRQSFTVLELNTTHGLTVGQTITGATSGAQGEIVGIYESPADKFETTSVGIVELSGTFEKDEILTVGANSAQFTFRPSNVSSGPNPDQRNFEATEAPWQAQQQDISEGWSSEDTRFLYSDANAWFNYTTPPNAAFTEIRCYDRPSWFAEADVISVSSWTVQVRAKVTQDGVTSQQQTDDTVRYTFHVDGIVVDPNTLVDYVDFTHEDEGRGWMEKSFTKTSPGSPYLPTVTVHQYEYTENGGQPDNLSLHIAEVDVILTVNCNIKILSDPVQVGIYLSEVEKDWQSAAKEIYRDAIQVVPGSGPINGIWRNKASTYAFRNNVGGTADVLHVASAAGWTTAGVVMSEYILFNSGGAAGANIEEGDQLVGQTSGATADIHRIVLNGGSSVWDGNGEGYFVLTNVSGTFQSPEVLESPAGTSFAVTYSVNTPLTFSPGGYWQFHSHNFYGGSGTFRVYAVNGVDECAYEIDENNVVSPIFLPGITLVGTAPNGNPYLIEEHKNYLFIAYPGGRMAHSVLGDPMLISGVLGSAEFGLGDEITGLNSVVGNVLVITTSSETRGLFGNDIADWDLRFIGENAGGRLYSTQKVDTVYALDEHGITSVARTDVYGDFIGSTVSQSVLPVIEKLKARFTASTIVRATSQYRLYFNEGSCLIMYVPSDPQREAEFGFATYPFAIDRIYNTVDENENERIWFSTSDPDYEGYVYEDQVGTSFDGEAIRSFLRPAFNHIGSPAYKKRFRRVEVEADSSSPVDLCFVADVAFGPETPTSLGDDCVFVDTDTLAGYWDVDNWDQFIWGASGVGGMLRADVTGSGTNMSLLMYNSSTDASPFVLKGMMVHYDDRKLLR